MVIKRQEDGPRDVLLFLPQRAQKMVCRESQGHGRNEISLMEFQ